MAQEKPNLNDFVIFPDYFGKYKEVGRVKILVRDVVSINGIVQNNPDWDYSEFWLDIDKFTYERIDIFTWIARVILK